MKNFHCSCGQQIYFESSRCVRCGRALAYDPQLQEVLTLQPLSEFVWESIHPAAPGKRVRLCDNYREQQVCNWLVAEEEPSHLCRACDLNRIIPNLDNPHNLGRWAALERAKKRLCYSLIFLGLPLVSKHRDPANGLCFDFLEDQRSNSEVAEGFVSTGHRGGVITINALEADDNARESQRAALGEPYRTLLGHFRHESGHYYWALFFMTDDAREDFRDCFGDERNDYAQALDNYYAHGPTPNWQTNHISAYAQSHPLEDWAETWAHYLHIIDTLETARTHELVRATDAAPDIDFLLNQWTDLSPALNELNRSLGRADAYPFVISPEVQRKLKFVHRTVEHFTRTS